MFLPKPIPYLQYRVCGGGSGIRVESSGYIFSPALASIERTSIVGLLLSDFHNSDYCLRLKPRVGMEGGRRCFFFLFLSTWVLKSEEICFQQVWMGERKGKRGVRAGGQGFGVHAQCVRCNISTSAYLQHLAVN